ncbi:MAG: hypothetical protein ACR2LK_08460 [Solirubrobacteraceae bacterium]
MRRTFLALLTAALVAGCGDSDDDSAGAQAQTSDIPTLTEPSGSKQAEDFTTFPDIVSAELKQTGDSYTASVTVSSPYDSPERYADGWRVLKAGTDEVLGEHMLAHDHADEQPFTRMQRDLKIPADVERVTIEGRDQDNGYGGETVTIDVPS